MLIKVQKESLFGEEKIHHSIYLGLLPQSKRNSHYNHPNYRQRNRRGSLPGKVNGGKPPAIAGSVFDEITGTVVKIAFHMLDAFLNS